jgi:2-polyprenyl-3-methyl-5-hydroxy-6-metoxy-1,4-benzoquinol methylase
MMANKEKVAVGSDTISANTNNSGNRMRPVPFFYYAPSLQEEEIKPPFHELRRSLDGYRADVSKILHQLERAVLLSEESERFLTTSTSPFTMTQKLREKRAKLATIIELDSFTLEALLQPFPFTTALADSNSNSETASSSSSSLSEKSTHEEETTGWVLKTRRRLRTDQLSPTQLSYSSMTSVLAHLTRDWTDLGSHIRQSYYIWLLRELLLSHHKGNQNSPTQRRVLVPGAGLGRLAKEIANLGYSVEANDSSIVMAAVAYQMLHHHHNYHPDEGLNNATANPKPTRMTTIHPFATDPFTNEVTASLRFQEVEIRRNNEPLLVGQIMDKTSDPTSNYLLQGELQGSLSYTVGDFVSVYSSPRRRGSFDSIVTCFFLDTATNIYEYIATIRHALIPHGGVWINLGPVQWHENAVIQPSVDELRLLIQDTFHFHIRHWQVDLMPINYRSIHENDTLDQHFSYLSSSTTSTRFEGYRPLRFVATTFLPGGDQRDENISDRIDSLRKSFDHMRYTN